MIDEYSLFIVVLCFIFAMLLACVADLIQQVRKIKQIEDWLEDSNGKEGEG